MPVTSFLTKVIDSFWQNVPETEEGFIYNRDDAYLMESNLFTDKRAWSIHDEDRRLYMLDNIKNMDSQNKPIFVGLREALMKSGFRCKPKATYSPNRNRKMNSRHSQDRCTPRIRTLPIKKFPSANTARSNIPSKGILHEHMQSNKKDRKRQTKEKSRIPQLHAEQSLNNAEHLSELTPTKHKPVDRINLKERQLTPTSIKKQSREEVNLIFHGNKEIQNSPNTSETDLNKETQVNFSGSSNSSNSLFQEESSTAISQQSMIEDEEQIQILPPFHKVVQPKISLQVEVLKKHNNCVSHDSQTKTREANIQPSGDCSHDKLWKGKTKMKNKRQSLSPIQESERSNSSIERAVRRNEMSQCRQNQNKKTSVVRNVYKEDKTVHNKQRESLSLEQMEPDEAERMTSKKTSVVRDTLEQVQNNRKPHKQREQRSTEVICCFYEKIKEEMDEADRRRYESEGRKSPPTPLIKVSPEEICCMYKRVQNSMEEADSQIGKEKDRRSKKDSRKIPLWKNIQNSSECITQEGECRIRGPSEEVTEIFQSKCRQEMESIDLLPRQRLQKGIPSNHVCTGCLRLREEIKTLVKKNESLKTKMSNMLRIKDILEKKLQTTESWINELRNNRISLLKRISDMGQEQNHLVKKVKTLLDEQKCSVTSSSSLQGKCESNGME